MTTALEERVSEEGIFTRLDPAPYALLSTEQQTFLNKLERFEAPYVEEKLLKDGILQSKEEYQRVFTEFKKYVALAKFYPGLRLAMPSRKVDEVWHQFILFTKQYQEFCNNFLGSYLHHIPKTSFTPGMPGNKENFVRLYQETFGTLQPIWEPQHHNTGCWSEDSCISCDGK